MMSFAYLAPPTALAAPILISHYDIFLIIDVIH